MLIHTNVVINVFRGMARNGKQTLATGSWTGNISVSTTNMD
jgi:hypothetical protein